MNKKYLYIGLLVPLVCRVQEQASVDGDRIEQVDEQDLQQNLLEQEYDAEDDDMHDEASEDSELDLNDAPEHARGNWYEKQQILKQAHDLYQEVRQKEAAVDQFEAAFIDKKNQLTNTFEEFSQSLAVTRAALYQAVIDELEKLEAATGTPVTQQERIKRAHDQDIKGMLVQLKKDLESIDELYKAADQAMAVLMQQLTATHHFEQNAFDSYQKIAHVLSDQVAKQLYAEIVAARENISGIYEYIKGDFTHYFDELSENSVKSITLVHQQLAALHERGLDLAKSPHETVAADRPVQPPSAEASAGYVSRFFSAIAIFFANIWRWLRGFFA